MIDHRSGWVPHLLFHEGAYLWLAELPVQLLEAGEEGQPKGAWHHVTRHGPLLLLLLLLLLVSSTSIFTKKLPNL